MALVTPPPPAPAASVRAGHAPTESVPQPVKPAEPASVPQAVKPAEPVSVAQAVKPAEPASVAQAVQPAEPRVVSAFLAELDPHLTSGTCHGHRSEECWAIASPRTPLPWRTAAFPIMLCPVGMAAGPADRRRKLAIVFPAAWPTRHGVRDRKATKSPISRKPASVRAYNYARKRLQPGGRKKVAHGVSHGSAQFRSQPRNGAEDRSPSNVSCPVPWPSSSPPSPPLSRGNASLCNRPRNGAAHAHVPWHCRRGPKSLERWVRGLAPPLPPPGQPR
jgi:hypothetical protein